VRERLFEWGARGPGSRGQGIGLNVAWSLAESQGGYLHLRDTSGPGATFVVGLPAVRERDDAAAQLA
jgi:signal transduction histidine kinase